jgi:hypothetical protein
VLRSVDGNWSENGKARGGQENEWTATSQQKLEGEVERRRVHITSPHCSYMVEYAVPLNTEKTSSAPLV